MPLVIRDDPDDLPFPRRPAASFDRRMGRALRSVFLFGLSSLYALGMLTAVMAVARPHGNGWTYTASALGLGALAVASAIGTRAALRRDRRG